MKKNRRAVLVGVGFVVTCCLIACHSFSTLRDPTDPKDGIGQVSINSNRVSGLVYYLPKGRIRITGDFKDGGGDSGAPGKASSGAGSRLRAALADGASDGDSGEKKNFVITIAADIEADPNERYYLKPVRNYFYNDDIHLTTNSKHLLIPGNATAEDQTAQIISTTASLVAQAAGLPAPKGGRKNLRASDGNHGRRTFASDRTGPKR